MASGLSIIHGGTSLCWSRQSLLVFWLTTDIMINSLLIAYWSTSAFDLTELVAREQSKLWWPAYDSVSKWCLGSYLIRLFITRHTSHSHDEGVTGIVNSSLNAAVQCPAIGSGLASKFAVYLKQKNISQQPLQAESRLAVIWSQRCSKQ